MTNQYSEVLTHVDDYGQANMVDVSNKAITHREAVAQGYIQLSKVAFDMVVQNQHAKGDVLSVARIAGIQAAKKCGDLIPLCHPLMLTKIQVDFYPDPSNNTIRVEALCKLAGKTGVEMEALTAVSVATLTLFDMCKAVDPLMTINGIQVLQKRGGKSADWERHTIK